MDEPVQRLLFIRNFTRPTGGNVVVRNYFRHAVAHPRLDSRVYFAPGSRHADSELWADLSSRYLVDTPDWTEYDFVFVNGKDWELIPRDSNGMRIIHLVQHLGYADDPVLRRHLSRRALRICVSDAARRSIVRHAVGPICVIPVGVDRQEFRDDGTRQPGSVLVLGVKAPELARAIGTKLRDFGVAAEVVTEWLPGYVSRLRSADIFVGLPLAREGFFRPPLEAMACGCAVVCSDSRGNRAHCRADVTCLQPRHGDVGDHVAAVVRLLAERDLRERLRRNGQMLARRFDLAVERARVHAVFHAMLGQG